ncbi:hypothetical protein A2814_02785 [Candidatus Nomurabacteria bacterium RIFCSPHIGHO2_01_FULL_38_19]|uniref:EfeO-type cupredoxin-like domain-containing protein n=1 Tax=Candidatus Nomurabacteria bacterium RIFCSPHIGHO2_01_FULL_38_19 TaxID=1801732 RepID=A0A1F6USB5_9BACT|nr:MAG: hypothetical protein A2814_02785 [Candidatus Nomurabacteria bacterium RIFCSPHIGHO2_01_FULL_38_19]
MKKTYIIIIVLVIVAGILFFGLRSKKLEAPTVGNENTNEVEVVGEENLPVSNAMPVLGEEGVGVDETIVVTEEKVKEFTVSAQNFSFSSSLITVKKGDKVKITFKNTQGFHDFKIDEYGVAAKQANAPTEEVLEFTADKAGSFEYYCSVGSHRALGMKGTLVVE